MHGVEVSSSSCFLHCPGLTAMQGAGWQCSVCTQLCTECLMLTRAWTQPSVNGVKPHYAQSCKLALLTRTFGELSVSMVTEQNKRTMGLTVFISLFSARSWLFTIKIQHLISCRSSAETYGHGHRLQSVTNYSGRAAHGRYGLHQHS